MPPLYRLAVLEGGSRCQKISRGSDAPSAQAAVTKSRSFDADTRLNSTFAVGRVFVHGLAGSVVAFYPLHGTHKEGLTGQAGGKAG